MTQHNQLAGCRILLAEDLPVQQRLIAQLLTHSGANVRIVGNGATACSEVLAAELMGRPYDVVLMDLQMPKLDGLEATRRIRLSLSMVPVIAVTARDEEGIQRECRAAGCCDYLAKPVNPQQLIAAVTRHWKVAASRTPRMAKNASCSQASCCSQTADGLCETC